MKLTQLLTIVLTFMLLAVNGQDPILSPSAVGTGTLVGISQPLRDIPPMTPEEIVAMKLKADEKTLNPKLRNREYPYASTALPKGPDGAWQKENGSNRQAATEPDLVFNAQSSPYYPPDDNGTAGPNHYMQTVNTTYAIYDKTGVKLAGPTNMNQLFGNVAGASCNDGDPIMLYDEMADRWMAAEFSFCGNPDRMLVAISVTNDPTGQWYQYSFVMNGMPDYEKFGIWHDGYYMGTNTGSGTDIYVFEREVMLAGGTSPKMVSFDNPWRPGSVDGFMMVPPLDCDGDAPPASQPGMFIAQVDDAFNGGTDQLWIYELDVDWATTTNSSFTRVQQLDVEPYDSNFGNNWNNIKQPNTSTELDGIPQVIMNVPQYRNWGSYQTIVVCHTVDVNQTDHAGIRWYELRKTTGPWTVRQTGTYAPDQHSRWMGSIMMNGSKELGLGYSISSTTEFPGIRYTGQTAAEYTAASGVMDVPEGIIHIGTASQTGQNRWGDYAQLCVDPADDETFWYTNQYESGGRKTKVASFNIGPLGPAVDFQVDNNFPCLNQPVQFTDMSTGTPTSWQWVFTPATVTFVDGTSATSQNPKVLFNGYGNYDVTLTATSPVGSNFLTNPAYISVNQANAQFEAATTNVVINNPVTYSDLSSCEVTSWEWNFGAGATPETASTQGPHQVVYNTVGPKTVTLTINGNITESKTDYITVITDTFIMTNQTLYTCSGTFLDPGGNYNYGNNQNFTTKFEPSQPGGQVSVQFTEFNLELSTNCTSDYLMIYNGRSIFSPLIGKFCGTASPGTVVADNPYGALTFVFKSNTSVGASGWLAQVSCVSAVTNPVALNALTYTDTRIDLSWELNPASDNVMLVYSATGNFGTPASGTTYATGEDIPGGGTVLYSGNATGYSHTMLTPATTYYYKAFAVNADNAYSSGINAEATTLSAPPMISVTPLSINANAEAGNTAFNVVSNTMWTAVSDAAWCTVTGNGTGAGILTANYTVNVVAIERTANITVTVPGLDPVVATLVQAGAVPTLSLDPIAVTVDTPAGTEDIIVTSNAPWTAVSDAPWCIATPSGTGNGIITLQFTENLRAEERVANISISVPGLGVSTVILTQTAAVAVLLIDPPVAIVVAQAGTATFNIDANFNWVASVDAPWVTIPANGTGEFIMNADITENLTLTERSAIITISGNELSINASIIQAAGEAMVYISPENAEVTYQAGIINLTVTSNTDWTATETADWMTITPSGTGNGTIAVNYTENTAYVDRVTPITVGVAGKLPVVVTVTQRASEVGIEETSVDGLRIYPNPANNRFVIEANKALYPQMTVRLSDPAGTTVLTEECKGKDRYTFDVSNLSAGTYTISIITIDKNVARKIVIVK